MFPSFAWRRQREVELITAPPEAPGDEPSPSGAAQGAGSPECCAAVGEVTTPVAGEPASAAQPTRGRHRGSGSIKKASVKQKAQFFEALIRSNTDTLVRCAPPCEDDDHSESDTASSDAESEGEEWQDYSEVQLVLRMPRPRQQPSDSGSSGGCHPQYGSPEDMAALIEQLQAQLSVRDREKQLTASALSRKTHECDNLVRVVRELADSRAKVVSSKATLQEKYAELQSEYHRMLRVAELSRTVSKENIAKSARVQRALRQTEDELFSTRKETVQLQTRSSKLKTENCQLKEKLNLLERLDCFDGVQESACMREFTRHRVCETY